MRADIIAIDWGTSNFRAFLLTRDKRILNKRFARLGILKIRKGYFHETLLEQIGDWLQQYTQIPVIMSGMIGSRQGWHEVPYLQCPTSLNQLAHHLHSVKIGSHQGWIVPGMRVDYDDGRTDVMRGEETQIIGSLTVNEDNDISQVFCLPGTHSKWAWVESNYLKQFTTYMTGEVFTVLARYTILGKLMRGNDINLSAFMEGEAWSNRQQDLLSQLFQVRTQVLAGRLSNEAVHSFLSGVLIGHELREALNSTIPNNIVTIVGNSRISQLYATALKERGIKAMVTDADRVTANGLIKIAELAKLI